MILLNACAKIDETTVGIGLIPEVDNVHTFEVFLPVEIDNFSLDDSTRITASSNNAVGMLLDPVFGETNAEIYFSVNPTTYGVYPFGNHETVEMDSIILNLSYVGMYGDTTQPLTLEVYEIDNDPNNFKADSIFLISDQIDHFSTVLGSKTFFPITLKDSIRIAEGSDTVYYTNVLRIPITDVDLKSRLLNWDTTHYYKNDSIFKTGFKGIAVKTAASSVNKKALTYWDLTNNNETKLTFYYRYKRTGETNFDTVSYSMVFDYAAGYYQGAQANLIQRTPNGDYLTAINNGTPDDELGYIQTSPGSYLKVRIKGLDTLQLTNRVINRAELVFKEVESAENGTFLPPNLLFIDAISSTGDSLFTIRRDFIPNTSSGIGYDVASLEGYYKDKQYKFNLSRYIQSIVSNKLPYYDLRVYSPYATYPYYEGYYGNSFSLLSSYLFISDFIAAGRVVVGGGSHSDENKKAYLRIVYTKL